MIPWSYSFLSDFSNCPKKAFHKFIARDLPKGEMSPELKFGIEVHSDLEKAIRGEVEVAPYMSLVTPMRAMSARAEVALGIGENLEPQDFWKATWGRGKLDVLIVKGDTAMLFDWKTGKEREDPRELFCQAILLKAHFPDVTKISGAYVWLKSMKLGTMYNLSNTDRALAGTRATMSAALECEARGEWPMKPNPLCGWCPCKQCSNNRS